MGLLTKLGFGTAADAVKTATDAAENVADIVERWHPSDKALHDMRQEDIAAQAKGVQEARAYDPRSSVAGEGILSILVNAVNVMVDAANRLVRPTLAFTCMGTLFGWWDVTLNTKDPLMTDLALSVFGFYFGVRGLTEDLPKLLKAIKNFRDGKSNK